jgi:hypothetical protein
MKTVYQRAFTARPFSMGEEMQSLQPGWLSKVSVVSVRFEVLAGVCCIFGREIRSKVIEASVMSVS